MYMRVLRPSQRMNLNIVFVTFHVLYYFQFDDVIVVTFKNKNKIILHTSSNQEIEEIYSRSSWAVYMVVLRVESLLSGGAKKKNRNL